jgi:hypothetical protein
MQIMWIPFGAFLLCCLGMAILFRRLEKAFAERRPDLWRELTGARAGPGFGRLRLHDYLGKMVRDGDAAIDDPVISVRVRAIRRLGIVAISLWVAMALLLVTRLGFRTL